MADNIQGDRYIESAGYNRTGGVLTVSAWHRKGQVRPGISPAEAGEILVGDHKVNKYQAGYKKPGLTPLSPDIWTEVPGQFALVRETQKDSPEAWYAWATAEYRFMQMQEMFQALEPLHAIWPLETAGVLDNGRIAWAMFRIGAYDIRGDAGISFFTVAEHLDARHAQQMFKNEIRIVCANTYQAAIDATQLKAAVRHSGDVHQAFADTTQLVALLSAKRQEDIDLLTAMSFRIASPEEVMAVLFKAVPDPKEPQLLKQYASLGVVNQKAEDLREDFEKRTKKAAEDRNAIQVEFELLNQDMPHMAYSFYNLTQAIAGWADHSFERTPDTASVSTILGKRAAKKEAGIKEIMKIMQGATV